MLSRIEKIEYTSIKKTMKESLDDFQTLFFVYKI